MTAGLLALLRYLEEYLFFVGQLATGSHFEIPRNNEGRQRTLLSTV